VELEKKKKREYMRRNDNGLTYFPNDVPRKTSFAHTLAANAERRQVWKI